MEVDMTKVRAAVNDSEADAMGKAGKPATSDEYGRQVGDPTGLPRLEDSEIIVLALQHYAVRHTSRAVHAIGAPDHGEHVRRVERAKALAEQFGDES